MPCDEIGLSLNPELAEHVWGCISPCLLTSVFPLMAAPFPMKTEARQGLSGNACPVSSADIALFAPSRVLLCPINTNVYERTSVLSFPVSPSSLLAVTSRYCSYQHMPRCHFSLAIGPCAVIILAEPPQVFYPR